MQATLSALLGRFTLRRIIAPTCGTIMQDIAGTAQGRWFFDTSSGEDRHLALVHDNVDPRVGVFSVGTSLTGSRSAPGRSPPPRAAA